MKPPAFNSQWPDYMPLPREDIFAIGVIGLNYCQLENMLMALFSAVTRLNNFQTAAIYHRLPNNLRKDVLLELLSKTTIPGEVRNSIEHFLSGFAVCADNRHGVMHSSSGGIHNTGENRGLVLERYSRAGNRLACFLTLDVLKVVADDIHRFSSYGAWVVSDVTSYATRVQTGTVDDFRCSLATSQEKPPLPTPLNWRSAASPKEPNIPHAASHLISAYRVRRDE